MKKRIMLHEFSSGYSWQGACTCILNLCYEKNLLLLFIFIICCYYIMP